MTTNKNANEALKAFDTAGVSEDVEPTSSYNPSMKLHDEDGTNVGLYVSGRYLRSRTIDNNGTKLMFIDLRLESTNSKATVKKGKGYVEVSVKAGDIVTVFASSRLYRAINGLQPGTRVFFEYEGQKKVETPRGRKLAHIYKVKALPGTLTTEDVEYIKVRSEKRVSDKDVQESRENSEAEAEAAMSHLED